MKSLCIKTNNKDILSYLNTEFEKINLDNFYMHQLRFKIYENIIVHYTGENLDLFFDKISSVLSDLIINFYEKKLLRRILEYNYFYFNSLEKRKIIDIACHFINNDLISKEDNFYAIHYAINDYIRKNKSIVLEGFVNFRLQNYMKNLDYVIDLSVNKYITDKEYIEFVNSLKLYVSLNTSSSSVIHLLYYHGDSILLDKNKNIIQTDADNTSTKYMSDISFSSNDYALNTLLDLIPKKLVIHLMDGKCDEFINTLKLVFENRYEICSSCDICKFYKINSN